MGHSAWLAVRADFPSPEGWMLEGSGVSQQGSKLVKDGVQVIQGTPTEPITRATLFLRLWRVPGPKKTEVTRATLSMVRPGRTDYVIKELIPDMELGPQAALDKAIAIAKRGDVATIHLNADLARLPKFRLAAAG